MKNKINLQSSQVLNKKFETKLNGYDPLQVDEYLDKILADYLYYENEIKILTKNLNFKDQIIKDKDEEIKLAQEETEILKAQLKEKSSSAINSAEFIKRIADLEKKITHIKQENK